MSFKKKFHRIISMFCVAVLLLPMVLGLSVSAAEKRYLGYPVNLLIGEKLPVNSFVDEKGKAAKIEIAEGQYTVSYTHLDVYKRQARLCVAHLSHSWTDGRVNQKVLSQPFGKGKSMTGQHIPDDRDVGKVFHEMLLSAQNNGLIKFFPL